MSWRSLDDLYPEVRDSIVAQGEGRPGWNCGCVRSRTLTRELWLCSYHEGLEDGIDLARQEQQEDHRERARSKRAVVKGE